MTRSLAFAALLALAAPAVAQDKPAPPPVNAGPFVPSPESVVADMLKLADVGPQDFVIDLGSGDGRIVLTAAKVFGARGFGVEIQDHLVRLSNEAAQKEGIADRARFMRADLFKTDISQATVVTLYLLPDTVNMLRDKLLKELRPGARVLTHDYPLAGWTPEKFVQMDLEDKVKISGVTTTLIYLYVVPAMVGGRWEAKLPAGLGATRASFELRQHVQKLGGSARLDGRETTLEDVRLRGDRIAFQLPLGNRRHASFTGTVRGGTIEGTVEAGGVRAPWTASLAQAR